MKPGFYDRQRKDGSPKAGIVCFFSLVFFGNADLRHDTGECCGRLSRPSRRAGHLAHAGGRSAPISAHRHDAICQDIAARRSRGGADLRRRSAAEIQLPDPRYSRRPLRQSDLLPGGTPGPGQSGRRTQGARCRPHHCHPYPEPSRQHEPAAARSRPKGDRGRHRVGDRSARRRVPPRRRSSAFRASAAPMSSRNMPKPTACRSGAPIFQPTTGVPSPPRASTTLRSSGSRPRARASCCCTISRRARSQRCRGF